jgi:hypothetical protein
VLLPSRFSVRLYALVSERNFSSIRQIKPAFDAANPLFDPINAAVRVRDLHFEVTNGSRHLAHVPFKCRHPHLQVSDVGLYVIELSLHLFEQFKRQDCDVAVVSHHNASAPEMISISSLVIAA